MCPGCMEVLALLVVGMSSTGGVAALIASKFRGEKKEEVKYLLPSQNNQEESCQK